MLLLSILMSWALSAQASPNFCVQTFNAYGPFYAPNTETRTELLVQELKTNGLCDLFFMQEMWNTNHFDHFQHLMNIDFGEQTLLLRADDIRQDELKSGLVSVTKSPAQNPFSFLYAINKDGIADDIREGFGVHKGFTTFDIKMAGGTINSLNTHLHQASVPVRLAQLTQLHQALLASHGYTVPWIFTGDLNFRPYSLEWQFLTKVMGFRDSYDEIAADKNACTYCAENPDAWDSDSRRIDYILYRSTPFVKFKPVLARVTFKGDPEQPLSDHYGLQTDFVFGEETAAPIVSPEERAKILTEVIYTLEGAGRYDLQSYIDFLKSQLELTKKNSY